MEFLEHNHHLYRVLCVIYCARNGKIIKASQISQDSGCIVPIYNTISGYFKNDSSAILHQWDPKYLDC